MIDHRLGAERDLPFTDRLPTWATWRLRCAERGLGDPVAQIDYQKEGITPRPKPIIPRLGRIASFLYDILHVDAYQAASLRAVLCDNIFQEAVVVSTHSEKAAMETSQVSSSSKQDLRESLTIAVRREPGSQVTPSEADWELHKATIIDIYKRTNMGRLQGSDGPF
ncbi:hypothetical protein CSOJ01_16019 [Colletotrichum sojae]|uniref:Uncharacterized protein n=1 Tax=Colletotrichum sojae TaxID=2175907 RepID=A0A8H6ILJ1_9PEZI|nr:hypothetical protein CSOJ01_16019 [Colletotrichum sojae]